MRRCWLCLIVPQNLTETRDCSGGNLENSIGGHWWIYEAPQSKKSDLSPAFRVRSEGILASFLINEVPPIFVSILESFRCFQFSQKCSVL